MLRLASWSVGAALILFVLILVLVRSLDLTAYRMRLESMVSTAVAREVTFDGALTVDLSLLPTVNVSGVHIANPDWASRANFAKAEALAIQFALLPLLKGKLEIVGILLKGADVLFERAANGRDNWTFGIAAQRDGDAESILPEIASLAIERSNVGYRSPNGKRYQTVVGSATVVLSQKMPVRMEASGQYQNLPVALTLRGGRLAELVAPSAAWPIEAEVVLGTTSLAIKGTLTRPDLPRGWNLALDLAGQEMVALETALGKDLPAFGPFQLRGTLSDKGGRYCLDNLYAEVGEGLVAGELRLDLKATPRLSGRLSADSIAVDRLFIFPAGEQKVEGGSGSEFDKLLPLPDLSGLELDLDLDIDELVYPSVPVLRNVRLLMRLAQGRLEVSSRRMTVGDVALRASATLRVRKDRLEVEIDAETDTLAFGRIVAGVFHGPPIAGKAQHIALRMRGSGRSLRQLLGQGSIDLSIGSADLQFSASTEAEPARVTMHQVRISSKDGGPVRLKADTRYAQIPVDLDLEIATVAHLLAERAAWPVRLEAQAQEMRLTLKGAIIDPLGARDLRLDVDFAGKSFAALKPYLDWSPSSQGPFQVKGQLRVEGKVAKLSRASLQLGDNRVRGELTWRADEPLPRLEANLNGEGIVLDDLIPASLEASDQKPLDNVPSGRVIPDFTLPVTTLAPMELAIQLDFERLKFRGRTLGALSLTAQLDDDRLTLYPLIASLSGTQLIASLRLQDFASAPLLDAWVKVPKLDYGRLLDDLKVVKGVEGSAEIEMALSGRGATLREVLSHAEGQVTLTGGVGRIPNRYLALWGGGAWRLLVPAELQGAGKSTRVNCIVSRHIVSNGVMRGQMLVDTADVTIAGEEATDLDNEEIRAVLQPAPKGLTVLNLGTPVEITGTLGNMHASLGSHDTLLVLGTIAVGVALPSALLYLLTDVGTGETNGCEAAMARWEGGAESPKPPGLINKARQLLRKLQHPLEDKAESR